MLGFPPSPRANASQPSFTPDLTSQPRARAGPTPIVPSPQPYTQAHLCLTTHLALVGAVQPDKHLHEGHQLHLKLQPRAHLYYGEEG